MTLDAFARTELARLRLQSVRGMPCARHAFNDRRRYQNKMDRSSMMRRGGASGALVRSSNAECALSRVRPSTEESKILSNVASDGV
jgi:hypothetical protein